MSFAHIWVIPEHLYNQHVWLKPRRRFRGINACPPLAGAQAVSPCSINPLILCSRYSEAKTNVTGFHRDIVSSLSIMAIATSYQSTYNLTSIYKLSTAARILNRIWPVTPSACRWGQQAEGNTGCVPLSSTSGV